jgi:hypothetical protein
MARKSRDLQKRFFCHVICSDFSATNFSQFSSLPKTVQNVSIHPNGLHNIFGLIALDFFVWLHHQCDQSQIWPPRFAAPSSP